MIDGLKPESVANNVMFAAFNRCNSTILLTWEDYVAGEAGVGGPGPPLGRPVQEGDGGVGEQGRVPGVAGSGGRGGWGVGEVEGMVGGKVGGGRVPWSSTRRRWAGRWAPDPSRGPRTRTAWWSCPRG